MLKLTAKRQATLPRALCEELGIEPGDELEVEREMLRGKPILGAARTGTRLVLGRIGTSLCDGQNARSEEHPGLHCARQSERTPQVNVGRRLLTGEPRAQAEVAAYFAHRGQPCRAIVDTRIGAS